MKQCFLCFTILMMMLLLMQSLCATDAPMTVCDNAGLLTEDEVLSLSEILDAYRTDYSIDVSIYTEYEMSGSDAQSTADDIYDYNYYGVGENDDGMLLYISCEPRNYAFTTFSRGRDVFGDSELEYLEDSILPYLRQNDYYGAFTEYVRISGEFLYNYNNPDSSINDDTGLGNSGVQYNYSENYSQEAEGLDFTGILIIAVISLVIAFILTAIKQSKMKTANSNPYAGDYVKSGSFRVDNSKDFYLYSTVSRTLKPTDDNSHGSSSSTGHISSSGRSHGGRSGGY